MLLPFFAIAQNNLPDGNLKNLDNENVSVETYMRNGKPLVISFWSTCCKPCIAELSEISDLYEDWIEEVDFNFIAVSVDDSRSVGKVRSMVDGKDWPFDVLLDQNQDFKRSLNVTSIPHTFIFNKDGKMVYQHQGYVPGNELELIRVLKEIK